MKTNFKQSFRVMKQLPLCLSLAFLAFLSYQAFFPSMPSNAAEATAELEIEIEPTLEMALDKTTISLTDGSETEVLPSSEGTEVTGEVNVYVTTNNSAGYQLSVYTQDGSTDMKHINTNVTASITATGGGTTLSPNTWGFQSSNIPGSWVAVGESESSAAPVNLSGSASSSGICSDILIASGDIDAYDQCVEDGTAEKNTITFGANVTDSLPSGRYTNDVVFSVTAPLSTVSSH